MTIHREPGEMHRLEMERIFAKFWLFGCLRHLLKTPGAYAARCIAGRNVLFVWSPDGIRCFDNVCAHRGSKLLPDGYGRSELRCPVHGWHYDVDGRVDRIPRDASFFGYSEAERSLLRLNEHRCWVAGNLVFVNFSKDPIDPLDQFHTNFIDTITAVSMLWDDEVYAMQRRISNGWKLSMEILMDYPHVPFVHSRSLGRITSVPNEPAVDAIVAASARIASRPLDVRDLSSGTETPMPNDGPHPWYTDVERYREENVYYTWIAFPNTQICCSNGGRTIQLENFDPLSAEETRVDTYFGTCKRKNPECEISPAVYLENFRFGQRVFQEDVNVCEGQQSNVGQVGTQSLGRIEGAIGHFRQYVNGLTR